MNITKIELELLRLKSEYSESEYNKYNRMRKKAKLFLLSIPKKCLLPEISRYKDNKIIFNWFDVKSGAFLSLKLNANLELILHFKKDLEETRKVYKFSKRIDNVLLRIIFDNFLDN